MKKLLLILVLAGLLSCSRASIEPLQVAASKQFSPARIDSVVLVPLTSSDPTVRSLNDSFLQTLKRATSLDIQMHGQVVVDPLIAARSYAGNGEVAAVLFGEIIKTGNSQQRAKSEYDPVSFSVSLFDTALSKVVWRADYQNYNRPVTDNLFELKDRLDQGISYRTSEQFFEEGFQLIALELERSRQRVGQ